MKYKSNIIAAGSGSVAGCVFSRNRFGPYIRNRSIPINPGSVFQFDVRQAFATGSQAWAGLTDVQRDAWNTYALNTPFTDSLGDTRFLTGFNWYVGINTLRLQSTLSRIDNAPVIFGGTPLTSPSITATDSTPDEIDVAFTNTDPWAGVAGGLPGKLYVFQGHPISPTRNFYKGPFRLMGTVTGGAVPPTSPATFPAVYSFTAGQRIAVRMIAQTGDGRLSADFITSTIAV